MESEGQKNKFLVHSVFFFNSADRVGSHAALSSCWRPAAVKLVGGEERSNHRVS